jgi:hypothetical protein
MEILCGTRERQCGTRRTRINKDIARICLINIVNIMESEHMKAGEVAKGLVA